MSLKPAAHVRKDHSKVPRETVCSAISSRTRRILVRIYDALRNMFHIFSPREANSTSFAAIVRIWLSLIHRSPNKIAWPTHVALERRVQDGGGDGKGVSSGRSFTSTKPS